VLGDWQLGSIITWRSGFPVNATDGVNRANTNIGVDRPNATGVSQSLGNPTTGEWFNVNAFGLPAPYTFGNAGRTFGTGPGLFSLDASLLKDFSVERFTIQFRAEALNFTNHANFANPDTRQGSSTFGQVTTLVSGNQARIIQLGLHLKF